MVIATASCCLHCCYAHPPGNFATQLVQPAAFPTGPNSDWEFSWLARNLAPVKNQKIHWASEPGSASMGLNIQNRGQIRFVRRGPAACAVSLSISYEVPDVLAPFANVSARAPPRQQALVSWGRLLVFCVAIGSPPAAVAQPCECRHFLALTAA